MNSLKLALVKLSKDVIEPLNLLDIAAYLKKKIPSIEIKIIDRAYDNVIKEILKFNPDIIGISAMTVEYPLAIKLCKTIKEKMQVTVIIGGVHISFLPSSFNQCFDLGILGEGELPFYRVLDLFIKERKINKDKLRDLDGVIFYEQNKLRIHPQKEIIQNLDEIPIKDRSLLNRKYFSKRPVYVLGKYKKGAFMITSRGCPYTCKFCISTRFFRKLRFDSAKKVVKEIKYLYHNYNIRYIHMWDDLFCCNIPRIKEIIKLLEQEGLLGKITFFASIRGNLATDEIFDLYKKLGVKSIGFGFESGSDRILKYLKGNSVSVKQNLDAIKKGVEKGFKMGTAFMIGIPTEKIRDMEKTRDVIKTCIDLGVSRLVFNILTPYPGCEIWEIAKRRGKVSENMDFSKLSFYDEIPLLLDKDVSIEEYLKIRKDILRLLNKLKYKCFIEYFLDDPIRTILSSFLKPYSSLLKLLGLKNEKEEVNEI